MKKFYIHHKYSNDLFWYFFHGTSINIKDIPAPHFTKINKFKINTSYKNNNICVEICDDTNWNRSDGYHLFDFHVYLMQNNIILNRGSSNLKVKDFQEILNNVKDKVKNNKKNLHLFYIDWEGDFHTITDKGCKFFVDEINPRQINNFYCFTNTFLSFIHSSGLNIKNAYFLKDYLNHYKFDNRLSYSIRRLEKFKVNRLNKLSKLSDVYCTYSSFYFNKDTDIIKDDEIVKLMNILTKNKNLKKIEKRGYGINDWGSETNENNINEIFFKILKISDVDIIDEWFNVNHISEKSVIRILCEKPILPTQYKLYDFYNKIQKKYGKTPYDLSFRYNSFDDMFNLLKEKLNTDDSWIEFKSELHTWVKITRKNLIEICYNNNSYLDLVLGDKLNGSLNNII